MMTIRVSHVRDRNAAKPAIEFLFLIFALASCGRQTHLVEIEFSASLGGRAANCASADHSPWLTDLRFYVSDPKLLGTDGVPVPLKLIEHGHWQQSGLALIDLEDGSGACVNGTPRMNAKVIGQVPAADYSGLMFTVSVPFEKNHADPLAADAPLDDSSMHWHWNSGYKFLRVGLANSSDGFWMHVGSAACEGTTGNITGCRHPNRISVSLLDYRPGDRIRVELDGLLQSVDLNDGVASDCSSGRAETSCRDPFRVLGLDFDTGEARGAQQLFHVVRP